MINITISYIRRFIMKTIWRFSILLVAALVLAGCGENKERRVVLGSGVGSDDPVTRPIREAFSVLIGEGVEVRDARVIRNDTGIMELNVRLYNNSQVTKRFQYKVDWFDEKGALISSKASVWQPVSVTGKSPLALRAVAPSKEASDYIMITRKAN